MGSAKHIAFKEVAADANRAVIVSENVYVGGDGNKSVTEIRTLTFRVEGDTRLIDWDQEFIATEGDVTFGDKKDAGLSIRVPTTMAVDTKKGGRIVTSTGITDKDAWSKRAPWVDYSGPVEGETVGVAMLNHPNSFRYPTSWHVRTYGLFTANCFGTLDKNDPNGPHTLKKAGSSPSTTASCSTRAMRKPAPSPPRSRNTPRKRSSRRGSAPRLGAERKSGRSTRFNTD